MITKELVDEIWKSEAVSKPNFQTSRHYRFARALQLLANDAVPRSRLNVVEKELTETKEKLIKVQDYANKAISDLEDRLEKAQISDAVANEAIALIEELREQNKSLKQHVQDLQPSQSQVSDEVRNKALEEAATECERQIMFEGGRQMSLAHHGVQAAAKAIRALQSIPRREENKYEDSQSRKPR